MAEPTASVIASNVASTAVTGTGIVILGVHTGLDYATVIAGLAGGSAALSYLEPTSHLKRAVEIISAAFLAGYSAPLLADVTISTLKKFSIVGDNPPSDGAQLILAFLVAYMAHGIVLPGIRKIATAFIGKYSK